MNKTSTLGSRRRSMDRERPHVTEIAISIDEELVSQR